MIWLGSVNLTEHGWGLVCLCSQLVDRGGADWSGKASVQVSWVSCTCYSPLQRASLFCGRSESWTEARGPREPRLQAGTLLLHDIGLAKARHEARSSPKTRKWTLLMEGTRKSYCKCYGYWQRKNCIFTINVAQMLCKFSLYEGNFRKRKALSWMIWKLRTVTPLKSQ